MAKAHVRVMYGACTGYMKGHASSIYRVGHVPGCKAHVRAMYGVCTGHVRGILGTCKGYVMAM
jgi:hypothetical protein